MINRNTVGGSAEHMDAMADLVTPMSRRQKRLVLTMVNEISVAVAAALRDRMGNLDDVEAGGCAMVPAVSPALTRCAALMDRFVDEDPDCAEAALELMMATLLYRVEQGQSVMTP